MLHYDLELFHKLLNSLSILANANTTFFSPDRKTLPSMTSPIPYLPQRSFCSQIRETKELNERCKVSDINAFNTFKQSDFFFVYKCHCGLIEVALRILKDEELLGYVLIGPFRDPNTKKEDLINIKKLGEKYNLNTNKLKTAYLKISPFSDDIEFALKTLCSVLFEYMENKNSLFRTQNVFSMQILPYLQENLNTPLSIESLCSIFRCSQKMLYRIFHDNTGVTPKEYIQNLRIETALKMLIKSDRSITEIADDVGFSDYSYFIKVFKAYMGHTPTYYRKHSSNKDFISLTSKSPL